MTFWDMQKFVNECQATNAGMLVNGHKTKKLLIGPIIKDLLLPVSVCIMPIVHISTFRLLGMHVSSDLKWSQHIDAISSKAASSLLFLKKMKHSGTGCDDMLYFYVTVIRSVLEFACLVWHSSLNAIQTKAFESLQQPQSDEHHLSK